MDELNLVFDPKTNTWKRFEEKDCYATVYVETEEDYKKLTAMIEQNKPKERYAKMFGGNAAYFCPVCEHHVGWFAPYCSRCGQRLEQMTMQFEEE